VLEAPPGMAGLSQVSGRSQLTFDEQCLLDIYYIENWSPALDIKILLRQIPKVLSGEGAY
ncbi:MAG TPA: sugar transferase, partial [Anaerolineae bacterium]